MLPIVPQGPSPLRIFPRCSVILPPRAFQKRTPIEKQSRGANLDTTIDGLKARGEIYVLHVIPSTDSFPPPPLPKCSIEENILEFSPHWPFQMYPPPPSRGGKTLCLIVADYTELGVYANSNVLCPVWGFLLVQF